MTGSVQLTSRQSAEFRRNGYLLVPQLFDAESIALLDKIARADRAIAAAGAMEDADGGKSKIWITHELHKNIYTAFVHCERIVQPMEQIFEGPVYHWHHKIMLKSARNDPYRDSHHPRYTPLARLEDDEVLRIGRAQWERMTERGA